MGRGSGLGRRLGLTDRRPTLWACVVVLAVLSMSGCGRPEPATLDIEVVEPLVPAALLPAPPALVVDVACGSPDPDRLGPVRCVATVSGVEVSVLVHRPAIDGRIRVESPALLVDAADVATRAAGRLEADLGFPVAVACRPAVRVAVPGQEFACRATDPEDRPMDLVATLVDTDGSFRLRFG